MSTDQEFREQLDEQFVTASLADGYPQLLAKYRELDLDQGMAVDERLAEYGYILQQLRKFIGMRREETLKHADDLDWLERYYRKFEEANQTEYPKERKELMFSIMRNEWLRHMIALVITERDERKEEEESHGSDYYRW